MKEFKFPYEDDRAEDQEEVRVKKGLDQIKYMIWYDYMKPEIEDYGEQFIKDIEQKLDGDDCWNWRKHAVDMVLKLKLAQI